MEMIAVFAPLAAFIVAGLFGKPLGDKGVQFITCASVILAAFASISLFFQININENMVDKSYTSVLGQWISSGDLSVQWALRIDSLSVVMMCVVNIISSCVHVYSIGYMKDDPAKGRFMAYLSLFTFTMLMLVTADNALQMFFGWEGVGLSSYLLIGFWNHKHSANTAAFKAFIMNRIGDFGLILGIIALFVTFGTLDFTQIFESAGKHAQDTYVFMGMEVHTLTLICLLLFMGAVGKSAQLGLHTWLPDAMEGPTPVSALIHAATMVTAGVFLIARFSPVFEYAPFALMIITVFGATTAFIAASIAMVQFDIKRVIAYSTMSQLGYMFFALGVSAYGAAMFHLMTHAFFNTLLFLGAGSVIHALSGEQDMRNMGGLHEKLPLTYAFMFVGCLALTGIWPFSGFYSKDIILGSVWSDHSWFGNYAYWLGVVTALMTAFYSWRLLFMTFYGSSRTRSEVMELVHDAPSTMKIPLLVLSTGAILAGGIFYGAFVGSHEVSPAKIEVAIEQQHVEDLNKEDIQKALIKAVEQAHETRDENQYINMWSRPYFWHDAIYVSPENDTVEAAHHAPFWVKQMPLLMGIIGIMLAYFLYIVRDDVPLILVSKTKPIYTLLKNNWFFDNVYNSVFVRSTLSLGWFFNRADKGTIDAAGPDGCAGFTCRFANNISNFQNGFVCRYALVMIVFLICLISWFVYKADPSFYKPKVMSEPFTTQETVQ